MSIATQTKPISTDLPWQVPADQHQHDTSGPCPLLAQMPQPLREAAEKAPHLFRYLHAIPIDQLGYPEYRAELSFDLARLSQVNFIYPVGDAGYAHVCTDPEDSYSNYVSIEPCFGIDLEVLMSKIEGGLVASIERLAGAESDEALAEALGAAAERGFAPSGSQQRQKGRKNETPSVALPKDELEAVKYLIIRDKVRLGALEPLLKDPNLDTISCSGVGRLFVQHRIFGHLKTGLAFDSIGQLDEFVLRIAEKAKKPVTGRTPVADAVLSDGARINIVFGSEISRRGTNFTISKSPSTPMSVLDLVALGTLDYTMVAYLSLLVREGMNIFICGEGGSGKTALLNALSVFVAADAKIVSIEDTPELRVPHSNWIREVVREGPAGESSSDVTVFALLKAALRQRPNVIVMGEIRGEEGNIAFQAMQTGHEVLATMHASSVEKLIQRLTGSPINVPKAYVDNLNAAIITGRVRLPDGRYGRRILSVNEIVTYDSRSDSFSFVEVFRWDSSKDRFEFVPQSYLMERKIAFRRGLSPENKKAIYDELSRREALFEALHARTSGFYELYELLSRAYSEGLM